MSVHHVPLHDLVPHVCREDCWCRPTWTTDDVLTHHAADNREETESECDSLVDEAWTLSCDAVRRVEGA